MKKIGKIIGFLGICVFVAGLSYVITKHLDKNLYLNTNLEVTFEDTKEWSLESFSKLSKEEALKIYPNTFIVKNNSLKSVKYDVIFEEINSNIKSSDLDYILYLNDKEVKDGTLSDLKDNILYQSKIRLKGTDTYKLYLYLNNKKEDVSYNYTIKINSK